MDLLALTDFKLVAQHGGFGKAAQASGRPKATLSCRVMALEESLGLRLLERSSRAFRPTEEGQALHARTEHLLGEMAEIGKGLGGAQGRPRGPLCVSQKPSQANGASRTPRAPSTASNPNPCCACRPR